MRRRFFVERFDGRSALLRGESAQHLARVLRATPGQLYELSDGASLWLGCVEEVKRDAIRFSLVEPLPIPSSTLHVALLLSIVKFDRFEWCLEKATELGVAAIVPLAAARSDKPLMAAAPKRAARWQKILVEAAQQARRMRPPQLLPLARPTVSFKEAVAPLTSTGDNPAEPPLRILLSERQGTASLRRLLTGRQARGAILAIGPEGGWTDSELEAARAAGFLEASLGSNILRTETAVVAALAVLNFALGAE
jgi:16S rRNA (uracil1498-N3)-methyltransferase